MTALTIDQQAAARLTGCDAAKATETALAAIDNETTIFSRIEADNARARAKALDTLAATGQSAGPLHGVTMAHKDMFDRAGSITGFGAHPEAGKLAQRTSTVLARLDAAGQVDLGRLYMSEFAMGPTGHNHHWGIPRNTAHPGAISGGSSSGSGAAVGAGLVRAALGSDTGGSIRLPAAANGVVGFKPTQGRVPMTGVMPLCFTQDTVGPLARTVAEARLVLSVIAGPDGIDPVCADVAPIPPRGTGVPDGLRVGFSDAGFLPAVSERMHDMLSTLRNAMTHQGIATETLDITDWASYGEAANVIAMSEAAAVHADRLALVPHVYGDQVRTRLAQAAAMPGFAYVRARQLRQLARKRALEQVFGKVDLLVIPTLPDTAPMAADVDIGGGQGIAQLIGSLVHFTRPINFFGFPALSLPVAMTEDGPLSVQVVGPDWSESVIADLAQWIESTVSAAA
ncbi:aspartyl/glutamyl-tRNA(Asn/Gln) amidotransferase subunit A [Thalassovita litoralis]|jgi:aspartyl-tRNA(Asn)/glutamyl-tRNA(Gln) amidotransferase subunit A|uniref:Aspartyl/glutamyl-tRNA(Asn/Gln) amidotransferase subunit A n=1 Tax=Thalassovita litoralis TaxID=1010611 RepID=A0A521C4S7_9RHOB|nr:amidase [Thalassovita litoralis]SMO54408.1 aspartyl/glutamyl-tRNA(Asn/Gln) amidotransferase subunit A [Thalassovita litoralis]